MWFEAADTLDCAAKLHVVAAGVFDAVTSMLSRSLALVVGAVGGGGGGVGGGGGGAVSLETIVAAADGTDASASADSSTGGAAAAVGADAVSGVGRV
jgi:hypothetical protein